MNCLLATSQVTFVPRNYDDFVCGAAACPHIGGLLILRNRDSRLLLKAAWLIGCGAWRTGLTLFLNMRPASRQRRASAYAACGKPVWTLDTINDPAAVDLVRHNSFDLILNARTRFIYRDAILSAPPLGCLNIHHGLLPEQRGTMCDLWALSEKRPAGFSIHAMTPDIDAGGILARVEVSNGHDTHYPCYLQRSCEMEYKTVSEVLQAIAITGQPTLQPNVRPDNLVMYRNPDRMQLRRMIRSGMKV